LGYKDDLDNPPLLIVSDIERIEIHPNFTGACRREPRRTASSGLGSGPRSFVWIRPRGAVRLVTRDL